MVRVVSVQESHRGRLARASPRSSWRGFNRRPLLRVRTILGFTGTNPAPDLHTSLFNELPVLDTVTIRDRDSWNQVKTKVDDLPHLLQSYFRWKTEFEQLGEPIKT